jgi:hypothetical protein
MIPNQFDHNRVEDYKEQLIHSGLFPRLSHLEYSYLDEHQLVFIADDRSPHPFGILLHSTGRVFVSNNPKYEYPQWTSKPFRFYIS